MRSQLLPREYPHRRARTAGEGCRPLAFRDPRRVGGARGGRWRVRRRGVRPHGDRGRRARPVGPRAGTPGRARPRGRAGRRDHLRQGLLRARPGRRRAADHVRAARASRGEGGPRRVHGRRAAWRRRARARWRSSSSTRRSKATPRWPSPTRWPSSCARFAAPEVLVGGKLLAERTFAEQATDDAVRGETIALVVLDRRADRLPGRARRRAAPAGRRAGDDRGLAARAQRAGRRRGGQRVRGERGHAARPRSRGRLQPARHRPLPRGARSGAGRAGRGAARPDDRRRGARRARLRPGRRHRARRPVRVRRPAAVGDGPRRRARGRRRPRSSASRSSRRSSPSATGASRAARRGSPERFGLLARLAAFAQRRPAAVAAHRRGRPDRAQRPGASGSRWPTPTRARSPRTAQERRVQERLERNFSTGAVEPITVLSSARRRDTLPQRMIKLRNVDGDPADRRRCRRRSRATTVDPLGSDDGDRAQQLVRDIRAPRLRALLVGGPAAELIDAKDSTAPAAAARAGRRVPADGAAAVRAHPLRARPAEGDRA